MASAAPKRQADEGGQQHRGEADLEREGDDAQELGVHAHQEPEGLGDALGDPVHVSASPRGARQRGGPAGPAGRRRS